MAACFQNGFKKSRQRFSRYGRYNRCVSTNRRPTVVVADYARPFARPLDGAMQLQDWHSAAKADPLNVCIGRIAASRQLYGAVAIVTSRPKNARTRPMPNAALGQNVIVRGHHSHATCAKKNRSPKVLVHGDLCGPVNIMAGNRRLQADILHSDRKSTRLNSSHH